MKVLMIEHFLPGNTYTKELCEELGKLCDITTLTKSSYVDDHKVNWTVKPCLFYPDLKNKFLSGCYIIMGWMNILKELVFGHYDIIHVQTFKVDTVEMFLYKHFAKQRLVHTAHNILPHEVSDKDKKKYEDFYKACSKIIVHNEYSKDLLTKGYRITDCITVMPHGIYNSQRILVNTKFEKTQENKIEILQLGMMRKYKGIDILLKALATLDEETKTRIHVTIAGKQYQAMDDTDYKGIIDRLDLINIVTFIPERISDENMDAMFKKADVCVFPYREVYGSGALLMAYTYQKPVIVSNIPALVEETESGKTGLIFESESPESLAKAIGSFVQASEEDIQSFQNNIKNLVSQKYNWKRSARLLYGCYQDVIKEKLSRRKNIV